ncbi:hypothetical protein EJ08DRAFT_313616 [Tothia fuscella]|uniref:Uncharacterized protein n=1 Tax=Tothia fuscella TaxID=1048955 RepID=A0A9P4NN49_9PEZI|nr:hypothetical protein EJ08DRAFT_313616 [Tothia fuscella]
MSAPQQNKKAGGWGSLLSGAVSGLESRLDSILADDETKATEEAARKAKAAAALKNNTLKAESRSNSRSQSRNRVNDRLHDRLAKAVGKASDGVRSGRTSSEMPSRMASPGLPRASTDSKHSDAQPEPSVAGAATTDTTEAEERTSLEEGSTDATEATESITETEIPTCHPADNLHDRPSARPSAESARPSLDSLPPNESIAPPSQTTLRRSPSFLESELSRVTEVQDEVNRNYQEELHAHLERIDALQAKLTYLAGQASSAARAASTDAASGSLEKKVAEQDQMIVQLMEEGQKLSKNEMKHLGTIKKLRIRMQEEDKQSVDLKRRLEKAEREREEQKERANMAEQKERAAQERLKSLPKLQQEMALLKGDKDSLLRDSMMNFQMSELKSVSSRIERRRRSSKSKRMQHGSKKSLSSLSWSCAVKSRTLKPSSNSSEVEAKRSHLTPLPMLKQNC